MMAFLQGFKIKDGVLESYTGSAKDIVIPNSVTHIGSSAFDGSAELRSVLVPGTVKRIGDRAFAECRNLESVVLQEGIEAIGSNVFTDCEKLRQVTYPDSIREYQGWTFYGTQLTAPVLNVSGSILVFCPTSVSGKEWSVPETVKTIAWQAFIDHKDLEVLHLPEGLETIEHMAFLECGFREITIPYSVREIGDSAFYCCERLEKVTVLNPETKVGKSVFDGCSNLKEIHYQNITDSDTLFHFRGQPFLIQCTKDFANLSHASTREFKKLTTLCAKGNPDAMLSLAEFFERYAQKEGASPFYRRAVNYWRYQAYCKGNEKAAHWFKTFFAEHPGERLESVLSENTEYCSNIYSFSIPGELLNQLGYSFFDSDKEYEIKRFAEEEGLVEASTFFDYESPDEDGFGAEYNYAWWFLDENMQPIPGVRRLIAEVRERNWSFFQDERKKAIEILRKQKIVSI